jgi:hypothetical protein
LLESCRRRIDRATYELASQHSISCPQGGDQIDQLQHRRSRVCPDNIAAIINRPAVRRSGNYDVVGIRISKYVLDALQAREVKDFRGQRLILACVSRQQCVKSAQRNLAKRAPLGDISGKTRHCAAPGITQRYKIPFLGVRHDPIGVNRHASNRAAIAHDGYNPNDERSLGNLADTTLGPRDCVITKYKCSGYEEVND